MGSKKNKFLKKHEEEQAAATGCNDMYPKFSLEFCFGNKRCIGKTNDETKLAVFEKLIFLSQSTWEDIKASGKEAGFEKIKKAFFNSHPNIPVKFKNDKKIDVFRIPGSLGRIIGYIEDEIFYIVWIDTKFDMYDH